MRTTVPVWKWPAFLMLGWLTLAAEESTADDHGKPAATKDAPADSADDFPFAPLPFRYRPLVQKGGDNVLPAIEPRLEHLWGLGESAAIVAYDRSSCIRLLPKNDGGFRVSKIGVVPETLYFLEFDFKYSEDARHDWTSDNPGLHGWIVTTAGNTEGPGTFRIYLPRKTSAWQSYQRFFFTRADVHSIRIELAFNGTAGAVYLRNARCKAVPIEAGAGLQTLTVGQNTWGELPRREEAAPPAGAVLYARRDPDELFFWSTPAKSEIHQPVEWAGTPGEIMVAAVGLWTPEPIDKATLRLTELRSETTPDLAPRFAWSKIQYLPRVSGDRASPQCTFYRSADFFLSRPGGVTCRARETTAFWLRLTIPATARPGTYTGSLLAESATGLVQAIPVRVRVYPFPLAPAADRCWGVYADDERWENRSDDQVLRELRDIKAHGIDCLLLDRSGDAVWDGRKITGWSLGKELTRFVTLAVKAKLRGPFIVDWWDQHERIARELRVAKQTVEQPADRWPVNLAAAYRDALRAFDAAWKTQRWPEWVYAGIDEPGYWKKDSPALFRFQYDSAHDAGIKTYCTSSNFPSDPLGRPLTYHCAEQAAFLTPERAQQFLHEGERSQQTMWIYNSGCYEGQVGNLRRNRFAVGFLLYKMGAAGTMSWTFQRPFGDNPFDDFSDIRGRQWCITYPDPEHPGENLDTPQWEAIRQGWLDYRYAATLAQAIDRAGRQAATKDLAREVEGEFKALLEEIPWGEKGTAISEATSRNCDDWRGRIAEAIMKLTSK